jgi:hypothetical protein
VNRKSGRASNGCCLLVKFHDSRFMFHVSRFTFHVSSSLIACSSRFTIHDLLFPVHYSLFPSSSMFVIAMSVRVRVNDSRRVTVTMRVQKIRRPQHLFIAK